MRASEPETKVIGIRLKRFILECRGCGKETNRCSKCNHSFCPRCTLTGRCGSCQTKQENVT